MPIDVALTDALLAVVAGREGFRLLYRSNGAATAGVGLLLVALAAAFGTFRYGGVPGLEGSHDGVTRLAGQVGMPLVGVGYLVAAFRPQDDRRARSYAFVVFILLAVAFVSVPWWTTVAGALGMTAVLVGAAALGRRWRPAILFGAVGALGVVINGLVVNGEGAVGPLSRIAWFHLGLAGSCWALGQGLWRLPLDQTETPDGQPQS